MTADENAAEQIERMGVEKGGEDEESIWWHGSDDRGKVMSIFGCLGSCI